MSPRNDAAAGSCQIHRTVTFGRRRTLATFDWIAFQNGGSGTGSGDFQLSFSNGDQLSLANLRAGTLQMNPTDWLTTNTITPAGAPTGLYLGTNFNFSGFVTPPGGC